MPLSWAYLKTGIASPPWQVPAFPQSRTFWIERYAVGQAPLRFMLILSANEEVEPWAQHEPQLKMIYHK